MAKPSGRARRTGRKRRPSTPRASTSSPPRFVGRDPSPVQEKYPPKPSGFRSPTPVVVTPPTAAAPPSGEPAPTSHPLITLDRGFDLDQFSSLLGESSIRVRVPRADLLEVLRRILEFMGFGVYVYSISVRPGPSDLLKEFVVELRRVDFSAEKQEWSPFVEREPAPGSSG